MAIPTAIKKNVGVNGLAEVRVLSDSLRVIFKADQDTYQVAKNGWERESGLYNVTLSKTNDEIKFVSPPGRPEPYLTKFLEFGNRLGRSEVEPGIPEPKIKPGGLRPGRNGGSYYVSDSLVVSAKLVVVEKGNYKGMTVPYEVPYLFEQYPGTLISMLKGSEGWIRKVEDFLRVTGLDLVNDEIPFSVNVLPWLEARIQAANAVFSTQLNEKGFVDKEGLRAIPVYLLDGGLLEDETPTSKKAKAFVDKVTKAKKPVKKVAKK